MVDLATFTPPDFTGQEWPPKADRERLTRYGLYRKLFRGEHASAFKYLGAKSDDGLQRKIYLIVNLPGMITRACADFLCGEPPKFLVTGGPELEEGQRDEQKDLLQEELKQLVKDSNLTRVVYQAEVSASHKGDAFFRVRDDGEKVLIEQVKPDSCFAVLNPDNCNEVLYQYVAWIHREPDHGSTKGRSFLRVEIHLRGAIVQQAYMLSDGDSKKVGPRAKLTVLYGSQAPPEWLYTGVDEPLLIHVPNFDGGDDWWGVSDYHDMDTLFEALNNRMSKSDAYLDKHSAPKLVGLPGTMDEQGNVDSKRLEYIEPESPEVGKYLPRYVTWDGSMPAAEWEVDQLLEFIFLVAEMSPALFGLDKAGSIESGRAMIMRMLRTTAKIVRKRMFFDPALKLVVTLAMMLRAKRYGAPQLDGREIDIAWQDGMPQDYPATVEAEARRVESGLSSRQAAIERIDGVTPQEAQAELARIRGEKDLNGGATTNGTGNGSGPAGPAATGAGEPGEAGDPSAEPAPEGLG